MTGMFSMNSSSYAFRWLASTLKHSYQSPFHDELGTCRAAISTAALQSLALNIAHQPLHQDTAVRACWCVTG